MTLSIQSLGDHIGAEVQGVDLRQPVDDETRARINAALVDHVALVFPDQQLAPKQLVAAAGLFGETMAQHFSQYTLPDHPHLASVSSREVSVRPDGTTAIRATMWHTDHTNHERPPKVTVLYGVEIPDAGGNTSIVNMRAAYAALPEGLKQRLVDMKTVNNLAVDPARGGTVRALPEDAEAHSNDVVHPMVRRHPEHDSKALYFHIAKTEKIVGMTPEDSTAFLRDLLDQAIRPEFVYRHRWRKGDVLAFDNRCAMHRAHGDFDRSQHRLLYRVIVEGDRPV